MVSKVKCLAQDEDHGLTEGVVYSVVRFDYVKDVIVLNDFDEEVLLFEGEYEAAEDEDKEIEE